MVGLPITRAQAAAPRAWTVSRGLTRVVVRANPFGFAVVDGRNGTTVASAKRSRSVSTPNPDYALYNDKHNGIDLAYPGLPDVSYQPLAFKTDRWAAVTAVTSSSLVENVRRFELATTDGKGAVLDVGIGDDGNARLAFRPRAGHVTAVEAAIDAPTGTPFFGGGQRFSGFNQRGKSIPLWISHGGNSDRLLSTNEIAAPFVWTPKGFGLWSEGTARGEMNVGVLSERPDALNVVLEDDHLNLVVYLGAPREIVREHTARSGRPVSVPPAWSFEPMVWQDDDTTTASVHALVDGMRVNNIPVGAVWLDNPWDAGKATFDFDPKRIPNGNKLIADLHAQGVRVMTWISPYVTNPLLSAAKARGDVVTGTRPDNNDATYLSLDPTGGAVLAPRGLDPHLDFTKPAAVDWWKQQLAKLVARGVDGVKIDRGEEDLSDSATFANGEPNRLNHNAYITRFHQAAYEAFASVRPNGDFLLLSRGGYTGDSQWTGHWAADNLSAPGIVGLRQALNSLLSLSASGFPFSGSDVGGYTGTRTPSNTGPGLPLETTYIRWAELGALSPVMETDFPPWWVSWKAVRAYRMYATLHHRLVPYIATYAERAAREGIPIVQPLPFAYPHDAHAARVSDEYLFGDDLLVAPITSIADPVQVSRAVYLPVGGWTDFWTGRHYNGGRTIQVVAPIDRLPLFVRDGASLPSNVNAASLLPLGK